MLNAESMKYNIPTVHVIGAGMAGLSAALQLTLMGMRVHVHESAPYAGGRCRSYFDRGLDCRIDNGNHLVLSGNVAVQDYLELSGAEHTINKAPEPLFPFMDIKTHERWIVHMNKGRIPWWIFDKDRRVKGSKPMDYLSGLRLLFPGEETKVASRLNAKTLLYRRLWEPLAVSALNTELSAASAKLLSNIMDQSFASGGRACCPMIPKIGLSETFVQPCLETIQKHGAEISYGQRLRKIEATPEGKVTALHFAKESIKLGKNDWVVLAVPAWVAKELIPDLPAPDSFRSITNLHYRVEAPSSPVGFTGLIGGLAEWAFVHPGTVSVTISCADRYDEPDNAKWAIAVWDDLAALFDLDRTKVPPYCLIREKRATFAATPAQDRMRPRAYIGWKNLALAGDWTATELPSTIEGALRSGTKAAEVVMRWKE
ncbi:MAG: hydroxysqualene dehydroxylase HpnE [Bdellovibrionales bacterium]